jgi:hypothetical protein
MTGRWGLKNKKCGNRKLCDDFAHLAYPYANNAFGFVVVRHIMEDAIISGVGYKKDAKDMGVMLNYCPFCGEKIDWFKKKETGK